LCWRPDCEFERFVRVCVVPSRPLIYEGMYVLSYAAAGMDVWLEVCHAYAQQLAAKGETHAAVSFLVCCNRATDAVRLYLAAGAFACVAIAPVCPWLSVRHSFRFPLSLVSSHGPTSDRHRLSLSAGKPSRLQRRVCGPVMRSSPRCWRPGRCGVSRAAAASRPQSGKLFCSVPVS
jgi:hypothetical protein